MGINPVPAITSEQTQSAPADRLVQTTQAPAQTSEQSSAPASGTRSESVTHGPSAASSASELPQDEVQLLRDQQTHGDVVVKYLDRSGNLVLQVPSSQVLGVARSIIQEFAAKSQAQAEEGTASPANLLPVSNGDNHGH